MKQKLCLLSAVLLLVCCTCENNELVRIPMVGPGEGVAEIFHSGGTISISTDFDATFEEPPYFEYHVQFLQDGERVVEKYCYPLTLSVWQRDPALVKNGITNAKYHALMKCDTELPEGTYTIKVVFFAEGSDYELIKNDLVLKVR